VKGRIDWQEVKTEVSLALSEFNRQGVKPTLRALFYWLVSRQVIPNTKAAYKALSRHMVKWRQEGTFAWDCLADTTRTVLGWLSDKELDENELDYWVKEVEQMIEELALDWVVKKLMPWEPTFSFGRWASQPVVCEIWIEKEALAQTVHNWTDDLYVPVKVNRGYASWTFIYQNVQALTKTLGDHDKVIVLYLGDLDPSGVDIQRFLKEALEFFGISEDEVELRRLAITEEQVEKFNLPPRPEDAETLAKLQRDPRTAGYTKKYIVELDALLAFAPQEFRQLVREAVLDIWDEDIYKELEAKREELKARLAKEKERLVQALRQKLIEIASQPEQTDSEDEDEFGGDCSDPYIHNHYTPW